jgi:hypothetical protein
MAPYIVKMKQRGNEAHLNCIARCFIRSPERSIASMYSLTASEGQELGCSGGGYCISRKNGQELGTLCSQLGQCGRVMFADRF